MHRRVAGDLAKHEGVLINFLFWFLQKDDVIEVRYPGQLASQRQAGGAGAGAGSQQQHRRQSQVRSLEDVPPELWQNPAELQKFIQNHRVLLQQLLHSDPQLADAVLADNPSFIHALLQKRTSQARNQEFEQQQRLAELNAQLQADPLNPYLQAQV